MPCIDNKRQPTRGPARAVGGLGLAGLILMAGCAPTRPPAPQPPVAPSPPPAAVTVPTPATPDPAARPRARDWKDYQRLAAQQLVRANPERTYMTPVVEPLRGIPVLEVELNADGSIRQIHVQRRPRPADAQHTTQLAIEAVRRAAPFPPVAHLPKPWRYSEVFLFDERDRFKPRTLDD